MPNSVRKELTGRGPVGKTAVVGAKDRQTNQVAAKAVQSTDKETLQGFVKDHADLQATVYTDDASAYEREALGQRVRLRTGAHQRSRVVLVHAEARVLRDVPQVQPEAS